MDQYVIVGNGIAAAGCIEGIRSCDKDTKIVVISKENHPVYCRPLISYYLKGKTPFEKMGYRPESFYADNGCELLYDQTAEKIDPDRKTVLSSRNQEISYKALCIAAGSSPFVPPFEGLDTVKERYSFMTLDDALALEKVLRPDARVMIIGGGLIGLKCAEGLFGKVKKLIICDLAERVLSSILDDDTAPMVQKRLTDNGIDLLMGDSAVKFEGNRAYMKSGKVVDFDILVTAVGVRPNTSLVSEAGGVTGRGIVIDEKMATSLPGVYSAGDCAEGFDISFGDRRVLALLPNAYMQGYTAGVNMAGGSKVFDNAIPMNS
ncbi:MAG: NAD(P)/FAD-dependent oxidoreductase, partial [Parasporobacterium sp.]|nr:NAD(P)/FAD-dependent oxidoreductase [Parasporobacterium sp.]